MYNLIYHITIIFTQFYTSSTTTEQFNLTAILYRHSVIVGMSVVLKITLSYKTVYT